MFKGKHILDLRKRNNQWCQFPKVRAGQHFTRHIFVRLLSPVRATREMHVKQGRIITCLPAAKQESREKYGKIYRLTFLH